MPKCEVKLFQPDVDCDAPPPEVHRREMESTIVWLCDPHNPLLDQAVDHAVVAAKIAGIERGP